MSMDAQDLENSEGEPLEGEAQSMESLLKEQSDFQEKLDKREVVWVKVVSVASDQVLVDIGEKREAVICASEFKDAEAPSPGRRVAAVLLGRGRGEKPTMLSAAKARWRLGWDQVVKAFESKERVRGKVSSAVKGGFMVDILGVPGFLPASLADLRPVRKPQSLIGTGVRCYILEVNKEKGQVILSRKAVLEEEMLKRKDKLLGELKTGDIRIGRVARVADSGVVVDIGGLEAFLHVSDVAWRAPEEAKAKLERGQKVRARVLKIEGDKVTVGMKQLTPHPGDAIRKKHPPKSVVHGEVVEVLPEGVRLRLPDKSTAFCPVSELPVEGVETPERDGAPRQVLPPIWPKAGDKASAIVIGIAPTFEVSCSIKRYEAIQDRKRVAQYLKGAPPLTLGQLLRED